MKAELEVEVNIALQFTPEEIEYITTAIAEGERKYALAKGEMWYNFLQTNELIKDDADWLITLTGRDIERVLLKSLENKLDEMGRGLFVALSECLNKARTQRDKLNSQLPDL